MTTRDWFHTWLSLRTPELRPRTIESYADLIDRYVDPAIGSVNLDELRPIQITALLAGIVSAGHTRTAELVYVLMKAALADADLPASPMLRVKRPKHKQQSPGAWTDAEIGVYIAALDGHRHQLPLMLGISLGLRRGEICGLRWEDIDFDNRVISIKNQRYRLSSGQIVDGPPKSETSVRSLPIPDGLLPLLRARRQISGYLCSLTPSGLDAAHRRLARSLDLPYIPLHGLRHSFATACLRHDGEMLCLQHLLGHSSYSITADIYSHPDAGMLRRSIDCAARSIFA